MSSDLLRIDLGCGAAKKPGFVGLDLAAGPGVDHAIDLTRERFPFDDESVDEVFSAHFLEHVTPPDHVFSEIGRVCKDGARIEIWTPYAYGPLSFLYGHLEHLAEEQWLHICVEYRDTFLPMLGGRWQLHRINYVVLPEITADLEAHGVPIDFAIKYFKGVVFEFGVEIEFLRRSDPAPIVPTRWWSTGRDEPRRQLGLPEPAAHASRVRRAVRRIRRRPRLGRP